MKSFRVWLLPVLIGHPALQAQTQIDLRTQSKSVDFSTASSTKPSQTGTVIPPTCSVGATFFNTAAPPGHNLYGCTATNSWTLLGANLWFGGGSFNSGDCAAFNSSGNIVSAGGACAPATSVTMANPFTAAGWLMVSAGPGRQAGASLCSNSGGTVTCPGGFTGSVAWPAGSGGNTRQILGPAGAFTSNFNYRWSDSIPTAATLMKIGAPAGGESSLGPAIPDTDYVTPSGGGSLQNKVFDGSSLFSSYQPWAQILSPAAPAPGYLRVYAKVGSGICWMNPAGTEACAQSGVSDPGGTGMLVETAPGTMANRAISAGSPNITVTNGSGAAGNPTVDIGPTVNFSGKATSPVQVGTAAGLPGTCSVGQLYFASDGVPGRQLQTCTAANTWAAIAYAQGAVNPVTCSVGQSFFNTSAAAGQNLYYCAAANSWTSMTGAIASIFGRTGAVTAQPGDYTYSQIANTPSALPPNGAASGDLSGSYPNPVVSRVNGAAIPAGGMLKANASHQLAAATAGTDYAPPTSGAAILKGNGAGGFSNATTGVDFMAPNSPLAAAQMPALTGDCTSSAGAVATNCSKTNGTPFAASATSDTTNAANITAGTLNAARLPATAMQTNQSNTIFGGTQDFHGAAHTLPVATGSAANKPTSCTVGEEYFATDATPGQNQFYCTSTNVWTQQAGASAVASVFGRMGAVTAQVGDYTYAQISNTPAAMPPNGAASGDLSGSYPNPMVAQINGAAVPAGGMLKANGSHQIVAAGAGSDYEVPLTFSGALNRAGSAIACTTASGSAGGCLSSADWAAFNSKQNALTNPITGAGAVGGLAKFTAAGTIGNAAAGSDYAPATSGSSLLKGNGGGGFASASAGTDYAPATTGSSLLKGSGSGGFANAAAGTDYAPATSGSALLKGNSAGGFASASAGTDYAPPTSGASLLKGNNSGGFASAVAGTDYAPAPSGAALLKGSGAGGFAAASVSDIVNLFTSCSGTQYLGADGACHASSGGGGSGYVTLTTGSGAPAANCAAPSSSNLAVYLDTTNGDEWWCYATNSWKKTLSVTGVGAYQVTGATGSAPTAPGSGMVACYFDQTSQTQVCLNATGGASTTVVGMSAATANNFVSYVDPAGVQHVAQPAYNQISGAPALPLSVANGGSGQSTYSPALTIAAGSIALATNSISAGTCQTVTAGSVNSAGAAGVASTDVVTWTPNSSIKGIYGYAPGTSGGLSIAAYPTSGYVNFDVCNWESAAVAPGAVTLNWRVVR